MDEFSLNPIEVEEESVTMQTTYIEIQQVIQDILQYSVKDGVSTRSGTQNG